MPRAARYFQPLLSQWVPNVPAGLYGCGVRLNKGYRGAILNVRRASDSAAQDCFSQKDITTFCAGTNGFAVTVYDQTVATVRDLTQATAASQAKIFDSATGLIKIGSTPYLSFDGVDDRYGRVGSIVGAGNVAITTGTLTRDDDATGGTTHLGLWYMGDSIAIALARYALQPRRDLTKWLLNHNIQASHFTPAPSLATLQYLVSEYPGNDTANETLRANGAALTKTSASAGALALQSSFTRMGCSLDAVNADTQFYLGLISVWAVYASTVTTATRTSIESVLNALKIS